MPVKVQWCPLDKKEQKLRTKKKWPALVVAVGGTTQPWQSYPFKIKFLILSLGLTMSNYLVNLLFCFVVFFIWLPLVKVLGKSPFQIIYPCLTFFSCLIWGHKTCFYSFSPPFGKSRCLMLSYLRFFHLFVVTGCQLCEALFFQWKYFLGEKHIWWKIYCLYLSKNIFDGKFIIEKCFSFM